MCWAVIDCNREVSLPGIESMKRIVFSGDCLRTESGGPNQLTNVIWLKDFLGPRLEAMLGVPSEATLPFPAEVWSILGHPPSMDSWAKLFWSKSTGGLRDFLRPLFEGALVVAFELSPLLEDTLNALDVPWIEVCISPLRFLPDYVISFRFAPGLNTPEQFRLTDTEVQRAVARVREYYGAPPPLKGTVFFAQTLNDRTQIGQHGFVGDAGLVEGLPKPLWVKPHPLCSDNPVVARLLHRGARLLEHNTYAALSADITVASIASSVVVEAEAFGRKTVVAHPDVLLRNASGLSTLDGHNHSSFWREVLSNFQLTDATFVEPFIPNALRSKFGAYGLDMAVYDVS